MEKTVVFDFDGVINSYKSGWTAVDDLPDEPVEGIKEVIEELRNTGYRVVVSSARASGTAGYVAIHDYLEKYGIVVDQLTSQKPPAIVYIDDRAICFDGDAEKLIQKLVNFVPWYNKPLKPMKSKYDEFMDKVKEKMITLYDASGPEEAVFFNDVDLIARELLGGII